MKSTPAERAKRAARSPNLLAAIEMAIIEAIEDAEENAVERAAARGKQFVEENFDDEEAGDACADFIRGEADET
jgi:hypothetical protein